MHPTLGEADQKSFRGPIGLYLKLLWLQAEVDSGGADVSGNADARPTQPELEVAALLSRQLGEVSRPSTRSTRSPSPPSTTRSAARGRSSCRWRRPTSCCLDRPLAILNPAPPWHQKLNNAAAVTVGWQLYSGEPRIAPSNVD